MARGSDFNRKRSGHADLNTSETLVSHSTWAALARERSGIRTPDNPAPLAPWAARRPQPESRPIKPVEAAQEAESAVPHALPQSTATTNPKQRLTGNDFLDRCITESHSFSASKIGFHGFWERETDRLLREALNSTEIRTSANSDEAFAENFRQLLVGALLRLAVAADHPRPNMSGTTHDFMLDKRREDIQLGTRVSTAVRTFANDCIIHFYDNSNRKRGQLGIPEIKRAFATHCYELISRTHLADRIAMPARTFALRKALNCAISNLDGVSQYDLTDERLLPVLTEQLLTRVGAYVHDHVSRDQNPSTAGCAALKGDSPHKLTPDVEQLITDFARTAVARFDITQATMPQRAVHSR